MKKLLESTLSFLINMFIDIFQTRHQQGDTHPLNLDEILDETNQLDVGLKIKHWLSTEVSKRSAS